MGGQLEELQTYLAQAVRTPVYIGATNAKQPRMLVLFPLPTEYDMTSAGNNTLRIRKCQLTVSTPSALETMSIFDDVVAVLQNYRLDSTGTQGSTVKVSPDDFGAVTVADRIEDGQVYSYMTLEWSE